MKRFRLQLITYEEGELREELSRKPYDRLPQVEEKANSKEMMVGYLLGLLQQPELDRFEADLCSDDQLIDELGAVEDELIDDYLSGRLTRSYRERFEHYFLLSPEHQEGLRFARSFHSFLAKSQTAPPSKTQGRVRGLWRNLTSFLRSCI